MIRRIVSLHPEAIAEGREARLWYRVRSQAVEERFRLALKAAIAAIRQAPERWPADEDGFRYQRVAGVSGHLKLKFSGHAIGRAS